MVGGMAMITMGVMMLINSVAANELVVGGQSGWIVPALAIFYQDWAAKQNFLVGDTLVFNFATGAHTVAILKMLDAYENCDITLDDNAELVTQGPYTRNLNSSGQLYFLCTVGNHCVNGLKFAANILDTQAAGPSPAFAPSPLVN